MTLANELVLIEGSGPERRNELLDAWLVEAGWDPNDCELRPPADHPLLGWKSCRVVNCDRPAWGLRKAGLCGGCHSRFTKSSSGTEIDAFVMIPIKTTSAGTRGRCEVQRGDVRCERTAKNQGLCAAHAAGLKLSTAEDIRAKADPLPSFGACSVFACDRPADRLGTLLCFAHGERWRKAPDRSEAAFQRWTAAEASIRDTRRTVMRGLHPVVIEQILFGVFTRARRGVQTRQDYLQDLVDFIRSKHVGDLRDIDVNERAWDPNRRNILTQLVGTIEAAHYTIEDFQHADRWPGAAFGKPDQVDFSLVSVPWLRDAVRAWAWGTVNRYRDFGAIKRTVSAVRVLSDYLSANGPENVSRLGREHAIGFATYLTALVAQKVPTGSSSANGPWTDKVRHFTLARNRLVIRWARDAGMLSAIPVSFNITSDLVPPRPRFSESDEAGRALPTPVLRQLLDGEALARLDQLWRPDASRFLILLAETGRRPTEICRLPLLCVDESSRGGPYLNYTEFKTTNGMARQLPITAADVRVIKEQQMYVRLQYPQSADQELVLFPRLTMNPRGAQPQSSDNVSTYMRSWVDSLETLSLGIGHDGSPTPFDRSLVFPYAFRHSYAQRRADAGVHPDVLKELMGHEQIQTTMTYYTVSAERRRAATDLVGSLTLTGSPMGARDRVSPGERLRRDVGTVAVPFGRCDEPSNVAAEGHACPIRWQCGGCSHFSTDPSFLPELRRHLADLQSQQARVDAFAGASDWAADRARPADQEVQRLKELIAEQEAKLDSLPPELRDAIEDASDELRRTRATSKSVTVTIRTRADGEDVLAPTVDVLREGATAVVRLDRGDPYDHRS